MIHIDGSSGEGGGQILRTSLSLAAITGQEITIENIRAKRDKPGLRPQHLTGALAVAEICGGELRGGAVGSMQLTMKPGEVKSGSYCFDVRKITSSAGAVSLILQTVLWPLVFAKDTSHITFKGGTHVPFAPCSHYLSEVFLPVMASIGLKYKYRMLQAGYYPTGGGELHLQIEPVESLEPIDLTNSVGKPAVEIVSAVSNLPVSIAERQLHQAVTRCKELKLVVNGKVMEIPSPGKGTVLFIKSKSDGAVAGVQSLGEIRRSAERVADDACDELQAYIESGCAVDKHLADQLIIPMALTKGSSKFSTCEITQHLLTNIEVVKKFLPVRFNVNGELGGAGVVEKMDG